MRIVELKKRDLKLEHKGIECFMERTVTKFGNSAKIDCPKQFIGRRVYVIVCTD